MLNPNEIATMKFDRVMGRGYKPDEVENFLRQVAGDFAAVQEEKQEIEQKMIVLADKLEEYKRDEESMRSALIGAQKLGDSVIRDAKAKASAIIDEAGGRAQLLLDNAHKTIEREQVAYARMQREVAAFKSKLQHLYKQHLEMISAIPADDALMEPPVVEPVHAAPIPEPEPAEPPEPEYIPEEQEAYEAPEPLEYEDELPPVEEAYDLPEEEMPEYADEPYEPEPVTEERPRDSKFGTLKFGKEYSITRDGKRRK